MHPLLTTLRWHGISRPIGSYGALLALALLVGAALALREGKRAGLDQGALISSLAGAVAGGFVGAFACSVAVRWVQLGSLQAALVAPGIVFYGALLGGAGGLYVSARGFGLPPLATMDALVPALPVAHALGRVGCFLGGCCYGAPVNADAGTLLPWAVHYPGELVARHPWPLYEAAALCVLAALFARIGPMRPAGSRALAYVLCYASLRLVLEPLRGDAVRGVFGGAHVSTSQLISLSLLALLGAFTLWRWRTDACRLRSSVRS